jgi:hypothetical protein
MGMLLCLIPQELWILVLIGTAFAVIFGLVPRGAIVGVVVGMLVLSIVGPIIGSLISALPSWISTILMIVFGLTVINWIITLIFGKRTGGHLTALLLHDIVLAPFRAVRFLLRGR